MKSKIQFDGEIKYNVYLLLPDKYKEVVNLSLANYEAKDYLSNTAIEDRSFIFVKELMETLKNENIESFGKKLSELEEYSDSKIFNRKTYEVVKTVEYLITKVSELIKAENDLLTNKVSASKDYSAEVEQVDFSVFPSWYSQVRALANNDILKFEAIKKLPYSDCFIELLYLTKDSDLERLIMKKK